MSTPQEYLEHATVAYRALGPMVGFALGAFGGALTRYEQNSREDRGHPLSRMWIPLGSVVANISALSIPETPLMHGVIAAASTVGDYAGSKVVDVLMKKRASFFADPNTLGLEKKL